MNKKSEDTKPTRPARLRTCGRCGQSINTLTDSWEMKTSEDKQYATGIQHVTCPPSPAMQELPPASVPFLPTEGSALAPGSGSSIPVFLTIEDAAKLLHVSKGTIRNRIRSGALPAKRLRGGQTVLIDQRDVLALLEDIPPGAAM